MPCRVTSLAGFYRRIEEHRLRIAVIKPGHLDIRPAFATSQVGRVDERQRAFQLQPATEQISHRCEDFPMDGLVGFVVGQHEAQFVTRKNRDALDGEPTSIFLSRAGQPIPLHEDVSFRLQQPLRDAASGFDRIDRLSPRQALQNCQIRSQTRRPRSIAANTVRAASSMRVIASSMNTAVISASGFRRCTDSIA